MDPAKVKMIQDWPEPRKVHNVQSFLGFANFYRRFIYNYANIANPVVLNPCHKLLEIFITLPNLVVPNPSYRLLLTIFLCI